MRLWVTVAFGAALAFGASCKKDEQYLEPNTSKPITPIHLKFGPPQFMVQPKDDGLAQQAKVVTDGLLLKEVLIDTLVKDRNGILWIYDTREGFGDAFQEQKVPIENLHRMTGHQLRVLLGPSSGGDGTRSWDGNTLIHTAVYNGRSGKALRVYQIIAQLTPKEEVIFLWVNTGRPSP